MKKRNLLLSAFMLFTALNTVKAQIDMEEMIKSFVDTTELLVNNGRRMILHNVRTGDFEKVAEIYEFLNERTSAYNCDVFTRDEIMHITILTNNWNEFLTRAEHFSNMTRRNPICYQPREFSLSETLRLAVRGNASQLFEDVLMADLTLEDKELLEIYLYFIGNNSRADEAYSEKLRNFKKNYPQSRYNNFIRQHLPIEQRRQPSKRQQPFEFPRLAFTFGVGATGIFPTGNLNSYFAPAPATAISMDLYISNFFLGLQVNGGFSMKLQTPLLSDATGYNQNFQKDERFSYKDIGVPVGYIVAQNRWLQFAPYINFGGTILESNLYTSQDNDLEFKIFDSFVIGPGLRTEIKLFGFRMKDKMIDIPASINLRFDVGYNIPVKYEFPPAKGNVFYTRMALVWWMGKF